MNIKNTYKYIIMIYTYDKIMDISLNLDKNNKLDETINSLIYKYLNVIPLIFSIV